jgi:hypothetical protein
MASEKEESSPLEGRLRLGAVRLSALLGLLLLFACIGVAASSSCVVATRDLPDGSEASPEPDMSADASDAGTDCGCCANTVLPVLPYCSGREAFAISAGDCPKPCKGTVAYAVCEGSCYTKCDCALPEDYTLIDGGFFIGDGGVLDAPGEARGKLGEETE